MLNPAVTAAQFPANRPPLLEDKAGLENLATTVLDSNQQGHTLQTQYSGASIDLEGGTQDNASQLITQGTEKEDFETAALLPYSSRYGTGYSMYEEFAGRSKAAENVDKSYEVLGGGTNDGVADHTRHRSQTASSGTQSVTGTPGKQQSLQVPGKKHTNVSATHSVDSVEEEITVDEENQDEADDLIPAEDPPPSFRNIPPPDLPFTLPYTGSLIPDMAITPTIMQLGDADILFKPLLKHLGIARKQPEHFIIKKNLQQVSATVELKRLTLTIVESSPRQRSRVKKSRGDKESSRNKASFPSFSSESLTMKLSLHECMDTGRQTPDVGDRPLKASPSESCGVPGSQSNCCRARAFCVTLHWTRAMPVINMPLLRLVTQLVQVGQALQEAQRHLPGSKSGTDTEPSTMNSDLSAAVLSQQATLPRLDSTDGPHGDTASYSSQADSEVLAQCWQTMYHLMNLYSGVSQPISSLETSHVIINPLFRVENEMAMGPSRERNSNLEYR